MKKEVLIQVEFLSSVTYNKMAFTTLNVYLIKVRPGPEGAWLPTTLIGFETCRQAGNETTVVSFDANQWQIVVDANGRECRPGENGADNVWLTGWSCVKYRNEIG
jgi:hypothetical protein